MRAGRIWLGLSGVVVVACGPVVEERLPQYRPMVCGREAPVQVLATDDPFHDFWTVGEVQGRLVVRRFDVQVVDGVRTGLFLADTVGKCGEDPVPLPLGLWPIIVGETLVGCDVLDGTIYALEPDAPERGPVLATGLECEPVTRLDEGVVLLDPAARRLVVLDAAGMVHPTSIEYAYIEGMGQDTLAPFLNNPLYTAYPRVSFGTDEGRLILDLGGGLWVLDPSTFAHSLLAEGVRAFDVDYVTDLVVIQRIEESEPGRYPIDILDLATGELREGPSSDRLRVGGGYIVLEEGAFGLVDGEIRPHPDAVGDATDLWVDGDGFGYYTSERFVVWAVESGEVFVDEPVRGHPCGGSSVREGVLRRYWGDERCTRREIWAYTFDGAEPQLEGVDETPYGTLWLSVDAFIVVPFGWGGPPGNFTFENRRTGEAWLIDSKVTGLKSGVGDALNFAAFEPGDVVYSVRGGGRTGLWRSALPEWEALERDGVGPGAMVSRSGRGEMLWRPVGAPGVEWSVGGAFDAGAARVTPGE